MPEGQSRLKTVKMNHTSFLPVEVFEKPIWTVLSSRLSSYKLDLKYFLFERSSQKFREVKHNRFVCCYWSCVTSKLPLTWQISSQHLLCQLKVMCVIAAKFSIVWDGHNRRSSSVEQLICTWSYNDDPSGLHGLVDRTWLVKLHTDSQQHKFWWNSRLISLSERTIEAAMAVYTSASIRR